MAALVARIVPVPALDVATRDAMWRVFERYYAEVARAVFERDLAEKQHVILLLDRAQRTVQGFSTLKVYSRTLDGRRFVAVYSGDTVLDAAYWGQRALHRAFVRFVILLKARHPLTPVYWFLISKGYRTYLLLSRYFPEYWPRHDRATPAHAQRIIDLLATDRFGAEYKPALGVVQFDAGHGRLKQGVAPLDASLLAQPDVGFFAARNPGHVRGDELCCLGRVGLGLLVQFSGRLLRHALPGPRASTAAPGAQRARDRAPSEGPA